MNFYGVITIIAQKERKDKKILKNKTTVDSLQSGTATVKFSTVHILDFKYLVKDYKISKLSWRRQRKLND